MTPRAAHLEVERLAFDHPLTVEQEFVLFRRMLCPGRNPNRYLAGLSLDR